MEKARPFDRACYRWVESNTPLPSTRQQSILLRPGTAQLPGSHAPVISAFRLSDVPLSEWRLREAPTWHRRSLYQEGALRSNEATSSSTCRPSQGVLGRRDAGLDPTRRGGSQEAPRSRGFDDGTNRRRGRTLLRASW